MLCVFCSRSRPGQCRQAHASSGSDVGQHRRLVLEESRTQIPTGFGQGKDNVPPEITPMGFHKVSVTFECTAECPRCSERTAKGRTASPWMDSRRDQRNPGERNWIQTKAACLTRLREGQILERLPIA